MRVKPEYTSLNHPIQYEFNQEILISARDTIDCAESYSLARVWTISRCNISTGQCDSIDLNGNLALGGVELYLPEKTLLIGSYKIEITVRLVTQSSTYSSSAAAYVQIIPSSLVYVDVIETRTKMITLGYDQDLLLEPGRFSLDGDGNPISIHVCLFPS